MWNLKRQKKYLLICLLALIFISTGCRNKRVNQKVFFIIDRFEGDYAVCEGEDSTFFNIPVSLIPSKAHEGSLLNMEMKNIDESIIRNGIKEKLSKILD